MSIAKIIATTLLLTMAASWCVAQAEPAASGPESAADSASQAAPMPAPITGQGGSLAFTSELARSNYISGGLSLASTFDDNTLNTSTNRVSDFTYSVLPFVALDQSRGRMKWKLDYSGGLSINQRLSSRNQGSHAAGLEADFRLSPHVTFRLQDRFTDTTNFFTDFNGTSNSPAGGVLQHPNQSVVTPLARQIGNFTGVEGEYQFGAGSIVGGSGSYYFSRFSDVTNGAGGTSSLQDTQSEQAQGFYTHRITPKNWAGFTYRFQRLTFGDGVNETLSHSILYFHTIYLSPTMTLSLFGGPEYTESSSQTVIPVFQLPLILMVSTPVDHQAWSGSGGASFAWQGRHTSARVEVVRRTSDGGGLLGAVRTNSVDASLRRQLNRFSSFEVGGGYATNDSVDFVAAPGSSIRGWTGQVSFEQRLVNNLALRVGYSRVNQRQSSTGTTPADIDHNRAWVSLSYNFSRPWGR
jgi:hypothetical protein